MSIELKHVGYVYEKDTAMARTALKDVSLTLPDGQFIGLIGHTGSGKSTLVQLLNGLEKPTQGCVLYDGEDVNADGYDRKALRAKVGLVFQYPEHQLFETDVFTDVCFGPKNLGLPQEEIERRAREALRQVGIEEEMFSQSPFDLSGGQKRRAAIAGVLAMQPKVLVLDEPTAGLDPGGRDEILSLIATLHRTVGITVVLVSHSMEDVANYVDRIIVLDHGEAVLDDAPKQVFRQTALLERIGLAAPRVTYVMRALHDEGLPVSVDVTTVEEAREEILRAFAAPGR